MIKTHCFVHEHVVVSNQLMVCNVRGIVYFEDGSFANLNTGNIYRATDTTILEIAKKDQEQQFTAYTHGPFCYESDQFIVYGKPTWTVRVYQGQTNEFVVIMRGDTDVTEDISMDENVLEMSDERRSLKAIRDAENPPAQPRNEDVEIIIWVPVGKQLMLIGEFKDVKSASLDGPIFILAEGSTNYQLDGANGCTLYMHGTGKIELKDITGSAKIVLNGEGKIVVRGWYVSKLELTINRDAAHDQLMFFPNVGELELSGDGNGHAHIGSFESQTGNVAYKIHTNSEYRPINEGLNR